MRPVYTHGKYVISVLWLQINDVASCLIDPPYFRPQSNLSILWIIVVTLKAGRNYDLTSTIYFFSNKVWWSTPLIFQMHPTKM
jgi:hypothetical protein